MTAVAPAQPINQTRLEERPGALVGAFAKGGVAGAVTLVWRNGEIVHRSALGVLDVEKALPMRHDALFRLRSMTKPLTSVLILRLMEEGRLQLTDPVTKWIPELARRRVLDNPEGALGEAAFARRDITIEDLLTHRSGIAYGFTASGPLAAAYDAAIGDFRSFRGTTDDFLKALASLPLSFMPGERFHYGHSTDVLGILAERVEDQPLHEIMRSRIFAPLGMSDTDFWVPPQSRARLAMAYSVAPDGVTLVRVPMEPGERTPLFASGGGGLVSSVDDYLKFARMLLNGGALGDVRIVQPETVALMTRNHLSAHQRRLPLMGADYWKAHGFGYGVSVITEPGLCADMGPGYQGAYGWPGSFGTWWQTDPVHNLIMLYMTQTVQTLAPQNVTLFKAPAQSLLRVFQEFVYSALGDPQLSVS